MIEVKGTDIIDMETGEVLGSTKPKFSGWKYGDYEAEFNKNKQLRYLEPMTAQEIEGLTAHIAENILVAEEKFDGHRALNFLTEKGNRAFSRRISKETGWFSENTDQVPHIRDLYIPENLMGTVLDNEALLPVEGCSCRTMQSVMGALPDKAIANQLEKGFAFFNCFDILYYCGTNIQAMPYWKRKLYEFKVVKAINSPYIKFAELYMTANVYEHLLALWKDCSAYDSDIVKYVHIVTDYEQLCVDFIKEGKEGLILKDIYARYEQKRTKSFIKMKAHQTYDVVIMGYEPPSSVVDLNEKKTKEEDWLYWETYEGDIYCNGKPKGWADEEMCPVTKFHAMGWIGAIKFGVWKERQLQYFLDLSGGNLDEAKKYIAKRKANGYVREGDKHHWELVEVGQTSGMDETVRKLLSDDNNNYIGKVIEVEAQHIINKETGSLQHPRFIQFRPDKNSEQCTFNDHIRKYGEDK